MSLYTDAREIWEAAIAASLPDQAVKRALADFTPGPGRLVLAAVGKAAWRMARAALDCLGDRVDGGVVITKHGHLAGPLPGLVCREAGHPVPDGDTFAAAVLLRATGDLREGDTVVLLLSGGGSALFEKPLCSPGELLDITGPLGRRDARRAVHTGACAIFHACCHNLLHARSAALLRDLYKTARFVLRAKAAADGGPDAAGIQALREWAAGADRDILERWEALRGGLALSGDQCAAWGGALLTWCQELITTYGDPAQG